MADECVFALWSVKTFLVEQAGGGGRLLSYNGDVRISLCQHYRISTDRPFVGRDVKPGTIVQANYEIDYGLPGAREHHAG